MYKKRENAVVVKSKEFAIESIKLYKFLVGTKKDFVISKQFLRSATSIGANIKEADISMSKKEFISKLNISLKEASETEYWLELLHESEYITKKQFDFFYSKCVELIKLLTAIIKTASDNLKKIN